MVVAAKATVATTPAITTVPIGARERESLDLVICVAKLINSTAEAYWLDYWLAAGEKLRAAG